MILQSLAIWWETAGPPVKTSKLIQGKPGFLRRPFGEGSFTYHDRPIYIPLLILVFSHLTGLVYFFNADFVRFVSVASLDMV